MDAGGGSLELPIVQTTGSHHHQVYWFEQGLAGELHSMPFLWLIDEARWVPRSSAFISPPMEGLVERGISHILWPSRLTIASRMQVAALLTNLRALPAKVWNNIPTDAKNRLFFDAPPPLFPAGAPSAQAVAAGARPSPVAHAKVFFAEMPRIATLYVG